MCVRVFVCGGEGLVTVCDAYQGCRSLLCCCSWSQKAPLEGVSAWLARLFSGDRHLPKYLLSFFLPEASPTVIRVVEQRSGGGIPMSVIIETQESEAIDNLICSAPALPPDELWLLLLLLLFLLLVVEAKMETTIILHSLQIWMRTQDLVLSSINSHYGPWFTPAK